jgi:hypothetical protein
MWGSPSKTLERRSKGDIKKTERPLGHQTPVKKVFQREGIDQPHQIASSETGSENYH